MIAQFKKTMIAVTLGASALATTAPAEAQRYGDGYRGRDNGGAAIIAGVAGLAIGAALASSANRRDDYYYDQGYDGPLVAYTPVYDGYYGGGYSYRGYNGNGGYNGYYSEHRGGYDRGGGYSDRRDRGGYHDGGGYARGGRDGYRR